MSAERAVGREMLFVEAVLLERRAARPGARHLAARHVEHVAVGDETVEHRPAFGTRHRDHRLQPRIAVAYRADPQHPYLPPQFGKQQRELIEIGRASGRERGWQYVLVPRVRDYSKKKNNK